MSLDIDSLFAEAEADRYALHARYLNEQMVRVLKTIGFDRAYQRGKGQYLYDREGRQYLDLLSGWGVFALGRNHPVVNDTLRKVLASDLPNLVQMDVSALAGVLAERLLRYVPHLEKVFFANSGTESVETAIKFARAATGRDGIVYCSHAFHGLTNGSLSLIGDKIFRDGFGPLLPGCIEVPFNDLGALEEALAARQVAAFIVEPIQGKGVSIAADDYLRSALELCRKHGSLFVADEIQTGLGRTGRFLACEHWGIEPDIVLLVEVAVRRAGPRRRGADAQMDLRQGLRSNGSCRRPRVDILEERSGHGGRTRHARGDRIRRADAECRTKGRAFARDVSSA